MRDLGARVVKVHPVPPPLLRRLLLVRHAVSSQTTEREVAAMKGLWQVNLQLLHTGGDAFAVRRWGCSSWQACACTRVGLTGGAQGLAGGTLRARNNAARCTRCCPRGHRGIIWELHCIGELCLCIRSDCACVGERVCRVFGEPMAARTDTVGRKRGRMPSTGVHRGVARAPRRISKNEAPNQGRPQQQRGVNGAGVEISKRNTDPNK